MAAEGCHFLYFQFYDYILHAVIALPISFPNLSTDAASSFLIYNSRRTLSVTDFNSLFIRALLPIAGLHCRVYIIL
ncbi:MAG: hypothetical protein ACI92I_000274 [Acidimicrobiales bacterium]|jgi:hypothetical protein